MHNNTAPRVIRGRFDRLYGWLVTFAVAVMVYGMIYLSARALR